MSCCSSRGPFLPSFFLNLEFLCSLGPRSLGCCSQVLLNLELKCSHPLVFLVASVSQSCGPMFPRYLHLPQNTNLSSRGGRVVIQPRWEFSFVNFRDFPYSALPKASLLFLCFSVITQHPGRTGPNTLPLGQGSQRSPATVVKKEAGTDEHPQPKRAP